MKTIKVKFSFLICLIFVLFVIAILHAGVFLPNTRDIQKWGRYVYTEPKLDIRIWGSLPKLILEENSFINHAENNSDWLDITDGIEELNFHNVDWDDLLCELCQNSSIRVRLGDVFKVLKPDDFLIFSNINRGDVEIFEYNSNIKHKLWRKRTGNKWSLFGKAQLARGKYISIAKDEGDILLIPRRIYKSWYKRIKNFIFKNNFGSSYFFEGKGNCRINLLKEEVNAKIRMGIECELNKEERINKLLIVKPKQLLDSQYFPNYVNRYTKEIDEEGNFNVNIFFDGDSEEDEYIRMPLGDSQIDIDLIEYPYLGLRYKVEYPKVQTVQVVLGIDFTGDRKPDMFYRQIYTTAETSLWTLYIYPVYEKIIEEYSAGKYMHIVFIEIYPHKLWDVDCSRVKQGMYNFWIKDIYFFNFDVTESEESLFLNIPAVDDTDWHTWDLEISYYSRPITEIEDSTIKIFKASEIQLQKCVPGIDLREYPFLKFSFGVKEQNELLGISVIVSLDFNGDGVADDNLIVKEDRLIFSSVNLLEMAENTFPRRGFYNIVKFSIKFNFRELPEYTDIDINRFILFRKNKMNVKDKDLFIGKSILQLNDKTLKIKDCFMRRNNSALWLETETNLRKGRYLIDDIFQNYFYERQGVEVEFGRDGHVKGANCKVIGFKRLNPTLYKVSIKTDKKPFWLIFNEYYHPGWKAYVLQDKDNINNIDKRLSWSTTLYTLIMRKTTCEVKYHFFVNNCANGWWINNFKDEELDILLVYAPQKGYEIALLVTGISMLGCLLGIWRLKKYM